MSRFGLEDDDQDVDAVPLNATCQDCGMDFSRAYDDQGRWCDGCSDRRDAHTSALEIRFASDGQMAPAVAARVLSAFARLPTLSAVAASRAGKPIPKKSIRRKEVA